VYPKIPGITVTQALNQQDANNILTPLAKFIAQLHNSGIFFGDIHFGNILQQENGDFALIDIQSIKIKHKPLSIRKRVSNLEKLICEEIDIISDFGLTRFLDLYLATSPLIARKWNKSYLLLKKRLAKFCQKTQQLAAKLAFFNVTSRIFILTTSASNQHYIEIQRPQLLGTSLNTLLQNGDTQILEKLAKFIAYLHDHGVFIGRWGFDSILQQQNDNFAFLDTTRISMRTSSLPLAKRAKELGRLISTQFKYIKNFGVKRFINFYIAKSLAAKNNQQKFNTEIQKYAAKKYGVFL
jgi:serine/threonine protein kinase